MGRFIKAVVVGVAIGLICGLVVSKFIDPKLGLLVVAVVGSMVANSLLRRYDSRNHP